MSTCPHCNLPILLTKPPVEQLQKPAPATAATTAEVNLVKCNRCGEENLCWQKSKSGKFYLCRTRIEAGKSVPLRKEFHQCSR